MPLGQAWLRGSHARRLRISTTNNLYKPIDLVRSIENTEGDTDAVALGRDANVLAGKIFEPSVRREIKHIDVRAMNA